MKKLILALAVFALLPVAAVAQDQRELLLTSDGRLFIAEQKFSGEHPEVGGGSMAYVAITIRDGETQQELVVPGTLEQGVHANPALAYDKTSQTLFVFWQRSLTLMHSELVFQSLGADLNWGPVASFGSVRNMRQNLRIAVTRKAQSPSIEDPSVTAVVPQINVHAVWWEFDVYDGVQSARYAMLTLENGMVVDTSVHNLYEFLPQPEHVAENLGDLEVPEVFKHPALFVSPHQDSVAVLFGDVRDNSFNRVRIQPWKVANEARVHIPVGRQEGGKMRAPVLSASANASVNAISASDERIALYTSESDIFRYVILSEEGWTEARELRLDATLNNDAAVRAVRRLVEHE